MRLPEGLIIGGGPGGSAAAICLARAGRQPLLVERSREPQDALCGGFMSWNTVGILRGLGVDVVDLGSTAIRSVALFAGTRRAEARLPAPSYALSRQVLDAALLAAAGRAGARVERGVHVARLEDGRAHLADGGVLSSDTVILATGKHDLRGAPRATRDDDPTLGLRWRLQSSERLTALLGDTVELHLFDGGYAGLVRQEGGIANLCMAVRKSALMEAGGSPAGLLEALARTHPHLGERLAATPIIGPPQAIANIPYGWVARPGGSEAPFRVGDQAAVIPSLAGEGMAIALISGHMAARAILQGQPAAAYQAAMRTRARAPVRLSVMLWKVAEQPALAPSMVGLTGMFPILARAAARLSRVAPWHSVRRWDGVHDAR